MSPFGKARPGRRPRCARPTVEAMESICLLSATPGLAQAKAAMHQPPAQVGRWQAMHEQQRLMQQVRSTLRAAGIPYCLLANMNRATLLADYQKALNGTTWQVRYRQPVRHRGPYLVEVPPAVPTTPTTPTTPTGPDTTPPTTPNQVTLATPTLSVQSVATRNTVLKVQAGPGGAPFGFEVRMATLASYQAAGNHFTDYDTTIARVDTPLAEGGVATIFVPGLDPGTQYIAQVVALPGSVTTPAPGTDYLQSPPGELVFSTQGLVQLESPALGTASIDTESAIVTVTTVGSSGAPFGLEIRMAPLADYLANGNAFPDSSNIATLNGPFAEGDVIGVEYSGLQQGTEYVVQAIARSGFSDTPAPGVDYMQSNPSPLLILKTLEVVQAEPPILELHEANLHTIVVDLTAGAQGAPGGWIMEVTTYEDFLANGWANAHEMWDVTPMTPFTTATIPVNQLPAGTAFVFRAEAEGGGLVTTSEYSNILIASTAVAPGDDC